MVQLHLLQLTWLNLLTELKADSLAGKAVFTELVVAYTQPARHYHNLRHIQELLDWAELVQQTTECLPVIKLAAWFHDYIYDPQAQDNEIKSAIYAEEALFQLGVAPDIILGVKQIILSTEHHQPLIDSIDNLIFLDLDLAILGASSERYLQYAASIRQEYNWLSDREYDQGRKRVLTNFLAREKIYYTDYFRQKLAHQAKVNLAREIELYS
jgi:predicted metal-dependent HD superfamily phosphohydrolase